MKMKKLLMNKEKKIVIYMYRRDILLCSEVEVQKRNFIQLHGFSF